SLQKPSSGQIGENSPYPPDRASCVRPHPGAWTPRGAIRTLAPLRTHHRLAESSDRGPPIPRSSGRARLERPRMFGKLVKKVFGTRHERQQKKLQPLVNRIAEVEASLKPLSDEQLQAKTNEFRERISRGESLDAILPEAFA